MATFSINQVRHFYVASDTNTVAVKGNSKSFKLEYVSPGGLVCSDIIDVDKILYANYTSASKMKHAFKTHTITVKKAPVAGEVYAVKVLFTNYAGGGDDNITVKYADAALNSSYKDASGATKTVSDANTLAEALRITLAKNLKDLVPLAEVGGTGATITITEVEQPYEVGVKPFAVMPFTVEIMEAEGSTAWAGVSISETKRDISGKKVADMEWFYAGARGDMYRGFGHPYGVKTKLVANPSASYDTIDIHYSYVGPNEGVQKSEKTITVAGSTAALSSLKEALGELGVDITVDDATGANVLPASEE